jgi:hypothetical protein
MFTTWKRTYNFLTYFALLYRKMLASPLHFAAFSSVFQLCILFKICKAQRIVFVLSGFSRALLEGGSSYNLNPSWAVGSWDSPVSIVMGDELDSWGSNPCRDKKFSLLHFVQTASGCNPALYPMGTGGRFPGVKAAEPWSWLLTSICCWGQEWWSYTSTPRHVFLAWYLSTGAASPFTWTVEFEYFRSVLLLVKS